jgi:acyl transferase domain-containing protein
LFPELLESVDADAAIASAVYPLPTFDAALQSKREATLTRTDVAQPALGALERGLLGVLARFGVEAKLVAGHSYGELVALHAAGVLSADGLAKASRQRGQLMAGDGSDRGTMLAVLAPLADIERLLAEEKLALVLANRNTPAQGVLSGARDEIAKAEVACKARSMRATRLNVGAAFHSPLVADAASSFAKALSEVSFSAPRIPVISNTTASVYPAEEAAARARPPSRSHQIAVRTVVAAVALPSAQPGPWRVVQRPRGWSWGPSFSAGSSISSQPFRRSCWLGPTPRFAVVAVVGGEHRPGEGQVGEKS